MKQAWIRAAAVVAGVVGCLMVGGEVSSQETAAPPSRIRAFYIGHSLASDIPDLVRALCQATPGVEFSFRDQNIPGSPLRWNWDERDKPEGRQARFEPQFQGHFHKVVPQGGFDTLVMVDSVPRGPEMMAETREYAGKFIGEFLKASPGGRVFIYEPWHCLKTGTPEGCAYDNSSPTRTLKWLERVAADAAMWDGLVRDLRTDFPGASIELIPAARALARLERAVVAGEVPGFKTLQDLFEDDIHPTPVGKYFVGALHYAMLTGRSPVGLPADVKDRWGRSYWNTPNWRQMSWPMPEAAAVRKMQEIAWEVAEGK